MQQSSMLFFCDECGAANAEDATTCVACQHPLLAQAETQAGPSPAVPVTLAPVTPLEVLAGAPLSLGPLKAGTLLAGRYRVVRVLGQGGFGSVYQARDLQRRGRLVAIKQIELGRLNPQEIIGATDTFNRELTILSTLSHPNLPKIFDHFTDASNWYLVMQYIKGQTLEELLDRSRHGYLPVNKVLKIGLTLMDVLGYLHSRRPPVIFRDLKPANIMITRWGHIYLIDFGIARRFTPEKKQDTGPLGSPGYAAPEQYGYAQTDARTDIYSLGKTLQTLLIGRHPLELEQGFLSRRPKPLPAELQTLINSMQEPDPQRRPAQISVIEERFSWWARRLANPLNIARGLSVGLFFWIWYGLLAWGVNTIKHTDFSYTPVTPTWVSLFLMVLNIFPVAVFLTLFYQVILLYLNKRRQMVLYTLALLALMLVFAQLGWLPALFDGYPFHTFNPSLPLPLPPAP